MARQALIPGVGYVSETGSRQALIPGVGYVSETSGGGGGSGGAVTIPPFSVSASGTPKVTGTAAVQMGAFSVSGSGPGAPVTSDCVTTAVDTSFHRKVFQARAGTDDYALAVSCTYTGTPAGIMFQAVDADTGAVVAQGAATTTSGGNASRTLTIPRYRANLLRLKTFDTGNVPAASTGSHTWAVNDKIEILGQSNGSNLRDISSGTLTPSPLASLFSIGGTWGDVSGDGLITIVNDLIAGGFGPVAVAVGASGGTDMAQWQPPSPGPIGGTWSNAFLGAGTLGGSNWGADARFGLWVHGEKDSSVDTPPTTRSTYRTGFRNFLNGLYTVTGRDATTFHLGIAILGNVGYPAPATDQTVDDIRQELMDIVETEPGCFLAENRIPDIRTDVAHTTAPYYAHDGHQIAQAFLNRSGLAVYGSGGVKITRATRRKGSNKVVLQVQHLSGGSALKTQDGGTSGVSLFGIRFFKNSVSQSFTTAFVGNTIELTVTPTPPDDGTAEAVDVYYGMMSSAASGSKFVYDNTSPGGDTIGFPLQPTRGQLTVSAPSVGGRLMGMFSALRTALSPI